MNEILIDSLISLEGRTAVETTYKIEDLFLPTTLKYLLNNCLAPLLQNIPREAILLGLLTKVAQLSGHHRLNVQYNNVLLPTNVYGILFMPSGSGKDKIISTIDRYLMKPVYEYFDQAQRAYLSKEFEKIKQEAEDKFQKSGAERERYVENMLPRELSTVFKSGTVEGLAAYRQAFQKANFGATYFYNSEFGDYIASDRSNSLDFISFLNDVYNFGDNEAKIIKGEKTARAVRGVPSNMLVHTSASGLLEGALNDKLLSFFNRGLARRSLICYPQMDETLEIISNDAERKLESEATHEMKAAESLFAEILESTATNRIFTISKEVDDLIRNYERVCAFDKPKNNFEALLSEMKNRYFKAIKVSGLIALLEHPDSNVIEKNDYLAAVYIVELYSKHFARFYEAKEPDSIEKLYDYLASHPGSTLMDIRQQKFVYKDKFSRWFNESIPLLEDLARKNLKDLIQEPFQNGGKRYSLINIS